MKKLTEFALVICIAMTAAPALAKAPVSNVIIPQPVEIKMLGGSCKADAVPNVKIVENFEYGDEGYILEITSRGIEITAGTPAGEFYARQSLDQLKYGVKRIPAQRIVDYPRLPWRGVLLDVSRHFRSKEFVKKQLLAMASLKLNRFHFHLVDGAGWRMQIDKYPLLTQVSAWRPAEYYYDWLEAENHTYCTENREGAYGGYYTKDDLREIVSFADSLHITVIPEVEMFGHSTEVMAVYPQLGCQGSKFVIDSKGRVEQGKAVYCLGKEAPFEFLEDVIDEVIEIFPSEYIHIGGDEANKRHWKACPDCQKRIADLGLKDEDELQSYGIARMERYINSKGRKIIGWDEILEGGLAPNAAVMSWRGEEGGQKAAASGHKVVMTPGAWCYIDKCQGNPEVDSVGFNGFLSIEKVYSYDPAPLTMSGREHVMGVQANLWTEMVMRDSHCEHMLYPRVFAIAEVGWTPQQSRNYKTFEPRAIAMSERLRSEGYCVYDMRSRDWVRKGSDKVNEHLAKGCSVKYLTPFSEKYAAGGYAALTDGLLGGWAIGENWQGWKESDCDYVVDLGSEKTVHEISASFGQWTKSEILFPVKVTFSCSVNGKDYTVLSEDETTLDYENKRPAYREFGWKDNSGVKARYIRVTGAINPEKKGWIFTDELIVK